MRYLVSTVHLFSPNSNRSGLRNRLLIAGLALASSFTTLLTGCSMSPTAFSSGATGSSSTEGVALTGNVHGGRQPVAGAHVYLYKAGTTGYGTGATSLLTSAVLTNGGGVDTNNNYYVVTADSTGTFTITGDYLLGSNCGSGDLVYIVATGGNPGNTGGVINPNLMLMTGLGPCDKLTPSTNIEINEVTTVASVYALQQFMTIPPTPTADTVPTVGTSAINATGLANAFATINNLVDTTNGTALQITPGYANGTTVGSTTYPVVAYLNSSTVPQARINSLANIIANCVNSTGGAAGDATTCGTFFTAATPATTAPTNTLQAILNVAQNPGKNVSALYALDSPSLPFQPSLSNPISAPTDWTLALSFSSGGLGGDPAGTPATSMVAKTLAIDQYGNVFVGADGPIIAAFNPFGAPLTVPTTITTGTTPTAVPGGYQGAGNNYLTFDTNGNLWSAPTSSVEFYELTPNLSSLSSSIVVPFTPIAAVYGLASDGNSNIWVGESGTNSKNTAEYTASVLQNNYPLFSSGLIGHTGNYSFDSNSNLWFMANSGKTFAATTTTTVAVSGTYGAVSLGTLAAGASGNMYGCSADSTGINVFNISNISAPTTTYPLTQGCNGYTAVDGLGNIWTTNQDASSTGMFLQELNSNGTLLSPSTTGYSGTSSAEFHTLNNVLSGVAIDGSGNLWAANSNTEETGTPSGTYYNALVEYVGVAAPVTTPLSLAISYGSVQVDTRP